MQHALVAEVDADVGRLEAGDPKHDNVACVWFRHTQPRSVPSGSQPMLSQKPGGIGSLGSVGVFAFVAGELDSEHVEVEEPDQPPTIQTVAAPTMRAIRKADISSSRIRTGLRTRKARNHAVDTVG